ncbi:hypothetical protein ACF3NT_06945 [Naumannella halotolerans]|uniref:hypothetical protein n=1 Tax=Naumannella halotolerans TaxID=993414 RepID=UPI00370D86E9
MTSPSPRPRHRSSPGTERHLRDVWDELEHDVVDEQCDCVTCTEARARLATVDLFAAAWRSGIEAAPQQPSNDLKASIMSAVRAEFRSGRKIPLKRAEAGELSVRESAITELVRQAVAVIPGVWPRGCRVLQPTEAPVDIEQAETVEPLQISVGLSVAVSQLHPALVERARRAIRERLHRELGPREIVIDLVVEEVHDD